MKSPSTDGLEEQAALLKFSMTAKTKFLQTIFFETIVTRNKKTICTEKKH